MDRPIFLQSLSFSIILAFVFFVFLTNVPAAHLELQNEISDPGTLDGVQVSLLSPDDRFLYSANTYGDSLSVFSRNPVSGKLSHVKTYRDGTESEDGLMGITGLTISGDGRFLYVVAYDSNALLLYERNMETGLLTRLSIYRSTETNLIHEPTSATLSPDGSRLYLSLNTRPYIMPFAVDPSTGHLSLLPAPSLPLHSTCTYTVFSPDGKFLYSIGRRLTAYSVSANGDLTIAQSIEDDSIPAIFEDDPVENALWGSIHMAMSNDGQYLYIVARYAHSLVAYKRDTTTGTLHKIQDMYGPNSGLNYPTNILIDRNQDLVLVNSEGDGELHLFSRNIATGLLERLNTYRSGEQGMIGLNGSYHSVQSHDGKHFYVSSRSDNAISTFTIDTSRTSLTQTEILMRKLLDPARINYPYKILLSQDETKLYVANYLDNSVGVYDFNRNTGKLTALQIFDASQAGSGTLTHPIDLDIHPNGRFLYVLSHDSGAITLFQINQETGLLGLHSAIPYTAEGIFEYYYKEISPLDLLLSPDGRNLYLSAVESTVDDILVSKIAVFDLSNDGSGFSFQKIEHLNDRTRFFYHLAMTPDGRNLYAAGTSIDHFRRNPVDGQLTHISKIFGTFYRPIFLSTDGSRLYFAMSNQNFEIGHIGTRQISVEDGTLSDKTPGGETLPQLSLQGENSKILGIPTNIYASPDHRFLYVLDAEGALRVFSIQGTEISLIEEHVDAAQGESENLGGAFSLAVTADGTKLIVGTALDDALLVFSRPERDLSVLGPHSSISATADTWFTESIYLTNRSQSQAEGITLTIEGSSGLRLIEANSGQGSCQIPGSLILCEIPILPAGGTSTVNLTLSAPDEGNYTVTVTASLEGIETSPEDNSVSFGITSNLGLYASDGDLAPRIGRDGIVTVADALVALRIALGLEAPTAPDLVHGDVAPLGQSGQPEPDGKVGIGDALLILRKALKLAEY